MLDFKKLEKPEGLTDEMLNDSKVQTFIQGMIDSQKTAAVSQITTQLDSVAAAKAIADQKVDEMKALVAEAKAKGGGKDGDDKEHRAIIQAFEQKLTDVNQLLKDSNTKVDRGDIRSFITGEISAYNAANPTVKIVAGAESYVMDAALATFKKNETGQIVPFKGDQVLTGNNGFMSGTEFITNFRTEKPLFFEKPSGGGANGSGNGGTGSKEMTRVDFQKLPPMEQGKIALTHTIIE